MEPSSSWKSQVTLSWSRRHVALSQFCLHTAASHPWGTPREQVRAQTCSVQCPTVLLPAGGQKEGLGVTSLMLNPFLLSWAQTDGHEATSSCWGVISRWKVAGMEPSAMGTFTSL